MRDASVPGWQKRAVEGVSKRADTVMGKKNVLNVGTNVPWQFKSLLTMAAKRRDISISGYIRRAIAAFIANDLEMPYEDVLEGLPFPAPHGKSSAMWTHDTYIPLDQDNGEGYGDWKNLAL